LRRDAALVGPLSKKSPQRQHSIYSPVALTASVANVPTCQRAEHELHA
jgi:hypothetical protein